MFFAVFLDKPNLLRRSALFATVLVLLGAILAGSLGSWRNYGDLGHADMEFNVATVCSEAGATGDIEPAVFPALRPVFVMPPPGRIFPADDPRPVTAVFVPHDRPPAVS